MPMPRCRTVGKLAVAGFQVVDPKRFAELPEEKVITWHRNGWLGLVHFHLASLERFADLLAPSGTARSSVEAGIGGGVALTPMTRNLRISVRPVLRLLASLLALLGGPAVSQAVDSMSSGGQAPPAWVAYAQEATRTVIGWLNADESPASGIRAVLEQTRPAPDQPTPPFGGEDMGGSFWGHHAGGVSRR